MPICTTCTHPIPYLYTVYESAFNLRLEKCDSCGEFADPYVEHDSLTLLIDLILLKRGVYRHLMYNRGTKPRRALMGSKKGKEKEKTVKTVPTIDVRQVRKNVASEKSRWIQIARLGGFLVAVDACIRWVYLNPNPAGERVPWTREMIGSLFRTLVGCFVETIAFHGGTMICSTIVFVILNRLRPQTGFGKSKDSVSSTREEFRISLIPLTLFYSSFTKMFLLFLLSIWRPSVSKAEPYDTAKLLDKFSMEDFVTFALQTIDTNRIDKEWVIRNVLGGMSAGFGLRVVLDCHPIYTSLIILGGWVIKTATARFISSWVGGDEQMGEAWLAYSIP